MNKPDKNDFDEWLEHRVTQWVFSEIEKAIQRAQEDLGNGASLDSRSVEKTALVTAGLVGFLDGLREIYNIKVVEEKE